MSRESALEIAVASPTEPESSALTSVLDDYLRALYPPEQNYLLSVEGLLQPGVTFVVARADAAVLGCGAILRHGREYVEIKRMFVQPWARGKRIGERILRYLEEMGRKEGFPLARLETGIRQPEALRLYEHAGYYRVGAFGDYEPGSLSVFMERTL